MSFNLYRGGMHSPEPTSAQQHTPSQPTDSQQLQDWQQQLTELQQQQQQQQHGMNQNFGNVNGNAGYNMMNYGNNGQGNYNGWHNDFAQNHNYQPQWINQQLLQQQQWQHQQAGQQLTQQTDDVARRLFPAPTQTPHTTTQRQPRPLPNDYEPQAIASEAMTVAAGTAMPLGSDLNCTEHVINRMATFNIKHPQYLRFISDGDLERMFNRHRDDTADPIVFTMQARICARIIRDDVIAKHNATLQQPPTGNITTTSTTDPGIALLGDGFKRLSKALANRRKLDPHRATGNSDDSDEDIFDVMQAWEDSGVNLGPRPERIDGHLLGRLQEKVLRSHEKGRPHISAASTNLIKHWSPKATAYFNVNPAFAKDRLEGRKQAFEGPVQLLRHLMTWGLSHVAVKAFDFQPFLRFYLHIMEVMDANDIATAKTYLITRLHLLQEEIDVSTNSGTINPTTGPDFHKTPKRFINDILIKERKDVLQDILLQQRYTTKSKTQREHDSVDICFYHNPSKNKTCPKGATCDRKHLDTTNPRHLKDFDTALELYQQKRQRQG